MKILKVWFAIALLCAAAPVLADPPSQVGRLNFLSGTVSFSAAETPNDWEFASRNRPITSGDRLWADQDGRAELRIGSSAIRLAPMTSVDVLSLNEGVTQLRLNQGTVSVRLRPTDGAGTFEINTPGGAVLLRPGVYRVAVDAAAATTTVLVRQGQADVLTGNAPVAVRDQQMAHLSPQGLALVAAPAPDEFDHWAAARDRQDERLAASRYLPPEMTGYQDLDQHGSWHAAPQYGNVWVPSRVSADWAPYRDGRWVWISPWGWTWVDNAPWGFAPYHYGRWVWLGSHWAWAPGARIARPVYAPALVAFVGGANWSVSLGVGPAVGWVPLGWGEPFIPWYRHSPAYVRNVNLTHVNNVNVIQHYGNAQNIGRLRYVNRDAPSATTVVSRETFATARQVREAPLHVPARALAAAPVTHEAPASRAERRGFAAQRADGVSPGVPAAREATTATVPENVPLPRRGERRDRGTEPTPTTPPTVMGSEQPLQQPVRANATPPQPVTQAETPRPRDERIGRAAERAPIAVPQPATAPVQDDGLRQREQQAQQEQARAAARQQQRLQEQQGMQQQAAPRADGVSPGAPAAREATTATVPENVPLPRRGERRDRGTEPTPTTPPTVMGSEQPLQQPVRANATPPQPVTQAETPRPRDERIGRAAERAPIAVPQPATAPVQDDGLRQREQQAQQEQARAAARQQQRLQEQQGMQQQAAPRQREVQQQQSQQVELQRSQEAQRQRAYQGQQAQQRAQEAQRLQSPPAQPTQQVDPQRQMQRQQQRDAQHVERAERQRPAAAAQSQPPAQPPQPARRSDAVRERPSQ